MLSYLALFGALNQAPLETQEKELLNVAANAAEPCPCYKPIIALCTMVIEQVEDDENTNAYMYETRIKKAACVLRSDSPDVERKKVQAMWTKFEDRLVCASTEFDVPDGSVIKFGVVSQFDAFLDDLINKWHVNLNRVDPADRRTVLDYVQYKYDNNRENANALTMNKYLKWFRAAGAKYAREL